MPTALENRALALVLEVGHAHAAENKIATIRDLRNATPVAERPFGLRAFKEAVEWALTQPRDFSAFLADWQNTPSYWRQYVFPNGRAVNISIDGRPDCAFRFTVDYDGEDGMFTAPGLSTAEVEAKLAEVAALPDTNPTT